MQQFISRLDIWVRCMHMWLYLVDCGLKFNSLSLEITLLSNIIVRLLHIILLARYIYS